MLLAGSHDERELHRANPVTHKRISLRKISTALNNTAKYRGSKAPRAFNSRTIKAIVEGPMPDKCEAERK